MKIPLIRPYRVHSALALVSITLLAGCHSDTGGQEAR